MNNFVKGLRLALALALGFPFLFFLLPVFFIYTFIEHRAGRSLPFDLRSMLADIFNPEKPFTPTHAATPRPDNVPHAIPKKHLDSTQESRVVGGNGHDVLPAELKDVGIALVTDGESPLGGEICRELARMGYGVGVVWRRNKGIADTIVTTIQKQGGVACALSLDMDNPEKLDALLDSVEEVLGGRLGLLINNFINLLPTPVENSSWESLNSVFQVNLQKPMWLSLKVAARMAVNGNGHIIHISDLFAEIPLRGHSVYSIAKAGLIMMVRAFAGELGPKIRVNAIAPGTIISFDGRSEGETQGSICPNCTTTAQPKAVVHALHYLLGAHLVTGEVLHVDGNRRMHQVKTNLVSAHN